VSMHLEEEGKMRALKKITSLRRVYPGLRDS
jgi:hypothetical protein